MSKTSDKIKFVFLAWLSVVLLAACGGGAETTGNQNTGGSVSLSLITASSSPDVVAFEKTVWRNLSSQNRCGRCHSTGGQQPQFVHGASIETAHAAALSFVNGMQVANLADPASSRMVTIISNGHKQVNGKSQACWLATDAACASAIQQFITDWNNETNGTGAVAQGVQLTAPSPLRNVGTSKAYPSAATGFASTVYPVLTANCSGCHTPTPADPKVAPQSPYFASADVNASYLAAQQKMDLLNPANSRFVLRLQNEFHNCWTTSCANDASAMETAITNFSNMITPTQVDPALIVSKAMKLLPPEAIVASGGERHVTSQIALWEFKSGVGATQAIDTSGVEPIINLSLSGDYSWVGGYGIQFNSSSPTTFNGRAQASYQASQKLLNNIRTRGEYSMEAWVIPANVVQQNKNIISYSGGLTDRNFTIAQNEYNYQFYNRAAPLNVASDKNGDPVLETAAGDRDLQASQQHIVMNYDPVNGRRMYVNGVFTGDTDVNDVGGLLNDWDNTFAFILANELGTSNGWQGTVRMVAVHNRILTAEQIQQNFKAGVGEKFFLLFSIGHIPGVPADSYIKVQAEQYDTYSYLFNNPVYVNLGNPVPAINFPVNGMRIGINGKEAIVGQSFVNLTPDGASMNITANNQEISRMGSVIQLQQGTQVDDFFLSFEELGTQSNPFVFAAPATPPTPVDRPVSSDIGVRTFSEINATMSDLTGVPTSNIAVLNKYGLLKQQLPSTEGLDAVGPANIIGISQLAFEYCDQLVEDTTLRDNFFGVAPYSFNGFGQDVSTAFGTGLSTQKQAVVNALYDRMIGIPSSAMGTALINAPTQADVMTELVDPANSPGVNQTVPPSPENLFDRLVLRSCPADLDCSVPQGTKEIVKAMCTSVLGSAAMLVQ